MIREIEASQPKFLIFVTAKTSWLTKPLSDRLILKWFRDYSSQNYIKSGIVDIVSLNKTEYQWDTDLNSYRPRSTPSIYIFKKLTGGDANAAKEK
jgi:hypothetical protein